MFVVLDDSSWEHYRPKLKRCGGICTVICITLCAGIMLMLLALMTVDKTQKIRVVYLAGSKPTYTTDEKFLSIALDTSIIAEDFKNFDFTNPRIIKLMKALSPAYFRIGGNMADRLIFTVLKSAHFKHYVGKELDGGECSYSDKFCDYLQRPNFTMNGLEWLQLNKLARDADLQLIFGLNALQRFDNGTWDYSNAETLIEFSSRHNLKLNWELGNEPNAFRHQFNYDVDAKQMAKDFHALRSILERYPIYGDSLVLGPDVTRPQANRNSSQIYLENFLLGVHQAIDAVTWHQYYFNGATADVDDFLNPENFDILIWQILRVKKITKSARMRNRPIWLGETSSAYGGGAPHLSNRFVATFLWLDKLGLAAKYGIDVVIRQSIYKGHYALINHLYNPTPDWWVSILYKKLVGNKVVQCHMQESSLVRLYCQCTQPKSYYNGVRSVTVFGVNIQNQRAKIRFEGFVPLGYEEIMKGLEVHAYVLTTVRRIDSRFIFLNGVMLNLTEDDDVPDLPPKIVLADPYVEMPPYSLAFWVIPVSGNAHPYC